MSDAEWLRGIVASGWNDDDYSPEVKAMFSRVADILDSRPPAPARTDEPQRTMADIDCPKCGNRFTLRWDPPGDVPETLKR